MIQYLTSAGSFIGKNIKNITIWIVIAIGFIFGMIYCTPPEILEGEGYICWRGRVCSWEVIHSGGKDFAHCATSWDKPCLKIKVDKYCKSLYKDDEKEISNCEKNYY